MKNQKCSHWMVTHTSFMPSLYLVEKQLWFYGKMMVTLLAPESHERMGQSNLLGLFSKSFQSSCCRLADGATEGGDGGTFSC